MLQCHSWQERMASRRQLRSPGCVGAGAEHQGALPARARKGGLPAAPGGGSGTRVRVRLPVPTPPTAQPAPLSVSVRLRKFATPGAQTPEPIWTWQGPSGIVEDTGGAGRKRFNKLGSSCHTCRRLELSSFTSSFVWTASSFCSDLF